MGSRITIGIYGFHIMQPLSHFLLELGSRLHLADLVSQVSSVGLRAASQCWKPGITLLISGTTDAGGNPLS